MSLTKVSRRSVWLCSLPGLILSAACLLPYLNKALTIDDPYFILIAQQIRKHPLHPLAVHICWLADNGCEPVFKLMPTNPLISYCLAPIANLTNPEWLAHLMQIAVLWCAIAATVALAFRFGFGAFAACAAGLILAATPPVLAMASTAMPEILAMALGVIGLERLLAWKQGGRAIDGVLSALALGLAPFARVHLIFLWPVALVLLRDDTAILQVQSWLAIPKRRWLPLAGAAIILATALALVHEPGSGIVPSHVRVDPGNIYLNFRSYLIDWILAMPLGVAWIVLRNRRVHPWLWTAAGACAVWKIWIRPAPVIWATMCVVLAGVVLVDILLWSLQSRDVRRIGCALWLLIPLMALPYIHLPVKYLVPCAPAAALLISDILPGLRWRRIALCCIVAAGAVWGSMVLHADSAFAEMGRQAAARLVAPHVAAGQHVWFASQWGFHWYALKAGAQPLQTDQVPAPGDYLVRGEMEGWRTTMKRLPPAVLVETYTVGGPSARTMSKKDGAGLYTNDFGNLMLVWGSGEWNRYELWRFP